MRWAGGPSGGRCAEEHSRGRPTLQRAVRWAGSPSVGGCAETRAGALPSVGRCAESRSHQRGDLPDPRAGAPSHGGVVRWDPLYTTAALPPIPSPGPPHIPRPGASLYRGVARCDTLPPAGSLQRGGAPRSPTAHTGLPPKPLARARRRPWGGSLGDTPLGGSPPCASPGRVLTQWDVRCGTTPPLAPRRRGGHGRSPPRSTSEARRCSKTPKSEEDSGPRPRAGASPRPHDRTRDDANQGDSLLPSGPAGA